MVKRAVAVALGALAGVLLWFAVVWARSAMPDDTVGVDTCVRDAYVDCVSFETPAPEVPAVQSCKDWLVRGTAGVAALSQCLHAARGAQDARRLKALELARNVAASS